LAKLQLHGFNNLTKTLSFNIYDICYAKTDAQRREYISYIDEIYNAERLTAILKDVTNIIGAEILNIAQQDYDPQGASVTILVSEHPEQPPKSYVSAAVLTATQSEAVVAHLDKSHVTVHTYPEAHPSDGICTFRADIDVSTCGLISPLKALNKLINSFDSDIVIMDYRVRGFTRDICGKKIYIDHEIDAITDYIAPDLCAKYNAINVNTARENIFHTKMLLKDFDLDNYLFGVDAADLEPQEADKINYKLRQEMDEIFHGRNL
jgi:S-adenosylmethionine decarboxylase